MVEFLSPGVKVQEKKSAATAILGVSTSNFATVGWLKRGPINQATLVDSLPVFLDKFGDFWDNSNTPDAVTAFFKNGGARAYIVRVVPDDADAATYTVPSNLWKFDASSPGTWGNLVRVMLRGSQNYYNQGTATYSRYDVLVLEESADGEGDFEVVETFPEVDLINSTDENGILTVLNDENSGSSLIVVTELTGGVPTALESVAVSAESLGTGDGNPTQTIAGTLAAPAAAPYTFKIYVDGVAEAEDDGRGNIIASSGSTFTSITGTINYTTGAFSIEFNPGVGLTLAVTADYYTAGAEYVSYDLAGGLEGTAVTRDQVSNPTLQADAKGLYALDVIDEILNIGLADFPGDAVVHGDLISYCDNRKDCFAIIDTPIGADTAAALQYKRVTLASMSSYAAMYWPAVKVPDNLRGGRNKIISNVGHVAGIYARTDSTRNVGKAPAGTEDGQLQYVNALERVVSPGMMDAIYPSNINPLFAGPLIGKAVWGVRTLQLVGDFNLVNVRRLFIFLEKSIYNSTQDLVFETIGEELFSRTKLRIDAFLGGLAQENYFASVVPEEAFRVTCDSTNNTPQTIAARKLIVDILVAPGTPAEFVLLRFERSLNKLS